MTPVPGRQHLPRGEYPARNTRLPEPRSGHDGSIPPWPESLIEPLDRELGRWHQLWSRPQAAVWTRKGQVDAVATLVRLELSCGQSRRPQAYRVAELARLRRELGLSPDA